MNRNITRGFAVAVLTGGFTILGATAASALDLPDIGGGEPQQILDSVTAVLPLQIKDQSIDLLQTPSAPTPLGEGVTLSPGALDADALPKLGVDTSSLLGENNQLDTIVGAPIDVSKAWVSVLGNDTKGVVIVPDLSADISALTNGLITSDLRLPLGLDCVTVTLLSDFTRDCGTPEPRTPGDPELPTEPETPGLTPVPGGENGDVNNGGTDTAEGLTDWCNTVPTSATTGLLLGSEQGGFMAAALAGALVAVGLMLIGSRLARRAV